MGSLYPANFSVSGSVDTAARTEGRLVTSGGIETKVHTKGRNHGEGKYHKGRVDKRHYGNKCLDSFLNVKVLVGAFKNEKALVPSLNLRFKL